MSGKPQKPTVKLRLILILNVGSPYSGAILNALLKRGIRPAKVLIVEKHVGFRELVDLRDLIADLRSIAVLIATTLRSFLNYLRAVSSSTDVDNYIRFKKQKLPFYDLFSRLRNHRIPYKYVRGLNAAETISELKRLKPDLVIPNAGRVGASILKIPTIGVLNAHPGLLPEYRGNDTLGWALLNGDPLGVTVHFMDRDYDTGAILFKRILPFSKEDDYRALHYRINVLGASEALSEAVELIDRGAYEATPQQEGTYWKPLTAAQLKDVEAKIALSAQATLD